MAKFEKYKKANGSENWMFQTYLGLDPSTGKPKRTTRRGFRTKKEAQLAEARLKLEVQNKGFETASKSVPTYHEVYLMWLEVYKHNVQESTLHKTIKLFENHILPAYGNLKIDRISVPVCQKSIHQWFKKTKNYKAINRYAGKVFTYAVSIGLTDDNPTLKINVPVNVAKIEDEKDDLGNFYTREELNHFLSCVATEANRTKSTKWLAFFQILGYTGLRKGEALALNWQDINFDNATLKVSKAITRGLNNRIIIQPPKTRSSNRKISLDRDTLDILKTWKEEQALINSTLLYESTDFNQLIFTNTKNEVINPAKPYQEMVKIYDRYSIDKRIKLHGFRHTHCSLLFESNATIKQVQDRLGHGDISTTMNVYAHVTPSSKEQIATDFADYMNQKKIV